MWVQLNIKRTQLSGKPFHLIKNCKNLSKHEYIYVLQWAMMDMR